MEITVKPVETADELRVVQADWLGGDAVLRARRPGSERLDWWRVGSGEPVPFSAAEIRNTAGFENEGTALPPLPDVEPDAE